ncbi:sigma-70 family RNA polymerase sigma factor [Paraclostridium sp. AKS46]|nr:sigma-70 family RNA polymerase sigma factor [Paraclostridium sp. AKS46]
MKKYDYKQIEKLVIKAQSGDNEAFEELYSTTYKNVYFYVLSILKDDTLAEDISQDVFLIVMKSINDLKNPKLFIAWVKKLHIIDVFKK